MVDEVKAGNVSIVIFKDQSRLGRDVLEVGLLKRTFEDNGVRYIAAADNLDSANGFDIMSVFRDVINEFYVSDCSKKIRTAKRNSALQGRVISKLPYGYKASDDRSTWVVDEGAAVIVKEIFEMYASGTGIADICRILTKREVPRPNDYLMGKPISAPWDVSSTCQMLENQAYTGLYQAQRVTTVSYKNHTQVKRPKEEWVVIENHHPPLVEIEVFETAQRLRNGRRRRTSLGELSIHSGLVFCSDCGSSLSYCMNGSKKMFPNFVCSRYRGCNVFGERKCTRHSIRLDVLEQIALNKLKDTVSLALDDVQTFTDMVYQSTNMDTENIIKVKAAEVTKANRRIAELDDIIKKIYEDRVSGILSDDRFAKMLSDYEKEQSQLAEATETLLADIEGLKAKKADLQSFMKLVNRFGRVVELNEEIARAFIEKIIVHEAVIKEGTKRVKESQAVDIHLTYIGRFNIE
jgi:hypothetical protein